MNQVQTRQEPTKYWKLIDYLGCVLFILIFVSIPFGTIYTLTTVILLFIYTISIIVYVKTKEAK